MRKLFKMTPEQRRERIELANKAFFSLCKPLTEYVQLVNYTTDGFKIYKPARLSLQQYVQTVIRMSDEEINEVLAGDVVVR